MEEISPAVLPFRIGNSLRESRQIELTRLKLMADTAAGAAAAMSEEGDGGDDSMGGTTVFGHGEDYSAMGGQETARLGDVAPGSDDDDTLSIGPEPSVASDSSSIAGSLDDLSNVDFETVKSVEIVASAPIMDELGIEVPGIRVDSNEVKALALAEEQLEVQEQRALRSVFLKECLPLWGCISICGRRPEMEDAFATVPRFFDIPLWMLIGDNVVEGLNPNKIGLPSHFFGVYDGHGGVQVANYCQERVHLALVEELRKSNGFLEGIVNNDWQKRWERAFIGCFKKVDDEIAGKATRGDVGSTSEASGVESSLCLSAPLEPIAPETVGSTAVVSVICSSHIIVANCGDSRAVLCRGKQAIPLSVDHKPNREDEYSRIEAAGGKVIQWNGHRVFGVLAMSRSIGDRYLKPWIIPEPEVRIMPRTKDDECLILASDGLWDVLSNEEVCDAARRRLHFWHKKNGAESDPTQRGVGADPASQLAAEYLSKLAQQRGSKDNITIIIIDLKNLRKFKTKA
ncbi:putative protein phosphatase 2C 6 [Apostasia shenzhenica]|uniref:protein-serine/threonine phosphatase n=1 Tax=Apostasia shenzhenica TaxID=1088818 RepID=A0A2I0A5Z5_9ASPA|nr:putative protein phosphatase 2C 6 [Apostasia shenzhenica]